MGTFLFVLWLVFPVNTDDMNTDSRGLFYNISPFLPEKGTIHILAQPGIGYGARPGFIDTSRGYIANYAGNLPHDCHYHGTGTVGIGYTILPQLQVFVGDHMYGNYIDRRPYPLYRSDTRFIAYPQILAAIKTGFPADIDSYKLSFGFVVWYAHWLDQLDGGTPNSWLLNEFKDCPVDVHNSEIGIRGITGLKSPLGTTFLNLGYLHIIRQNDQVGFNSFGIGQEFDLWHHVHPGIEVAKQDTIGSLIPQVKFLLPFFTIKVGLSIPIFSEFDWVPDDTLSKTPKIMLSLSPHITIKRVPPPIPTIVINGRVYDSLSTTSLPATISFIGPLSGKIETKNGEYNLAFLNPGAYRIGIESPDFWWEERTFHLMDHDTVFVNWPLRRKVTWSITGKILDKKTKKGVPATVRLVGKEKAEDLSDPASGEYKLWVHKGEYEFQIDADGYYPEKIKIKASDTESLHKDIYLISTQYSKEPSKRGKPPEGKKRRVKKKRK